MYGIYKEFDDGDKVDSLSVAHLTTEKDAEAAADYLNQLQDEGIEPLFFEGEGTWHHRQIDVLFEDFEAFKASIQNVVDADRKDQAKMNEEEE